MAPLTAFYAAPSGDADHLGSCSEEHGAYPKTIRFEIAAFIHGRLGKWLEEPYQTSGWMFRTDQRGFGGDSARLFGYGSIESDSIGKVDKVSVSYGTYGTTRRRIITRNGVRQWEYQRKSARVVWQTHTVSVQEPGGACRTEVTMRVSGKHPFSPPPASPAIDLEVTIEFRKTGPDSVAVAARGTRDRYPFYEVRVPAADVLGRHSRLAGQLYEYQPRDDFPGFSNLTSPEPFSSPVAVVNKAATDCCAKERAVSQSREAGQVPASRTVTSYEPLG